MAWWLHIKKERFRLKNYFCQTIYSCLSILNLAISSVYAMTRSLKIRLFSSFPIFFFLSCILHMHGTQKGAELFSLVSNFDLLTFKYKVAKEQTVQCTTLEPHHIKMVNTVLKICLMEHEFGLPLWLEHLSVPEVVCIFSQK